MLNGHVFSKEIYLDELQEIYVNQYRKLKNLNKKLNFFTQRNLSYAFPLLTAVRQKIIIYG